jgi:hypothetical protein
VHVPVRRFRGDHGELARRGILARDVDPARLTFHEDALVSVLSFAQQHVGPPHAAHPPSPALSAAETPAVLDRLARQGVLAPVGLDDPRIRFAEPAVADRLADVVAAGEAVYLRVDPRSARDRTITFPDGSDDDRVRDIVARAIDGRRVCTYCSVPTLSPRQATLVARPPGAERSYELGFTFAPVGDPHDVCHFLAWDHPGPGERLLTMEPQPFSVRDLGLLVRAIGADIARFCRAHGVDDPGPPISGGCNHWAGNSMYHQHDQFFRLRDVPLLRAVRPIEGRRPEPPVAARDGVEVRQVAAPWPCPAFVVRSTEPGPGRDDDVLRVADEVAQAWRALTDAPDLSAGNGIAVTHHTQNVFVTTDRGQTVAVVVPRLSDRVDTSVTVLADGVELSKHNAGVLEMVGYFVIDDPAHFDALAALPDTARRRLTDTWLAELAPDRPSIDEFVAAVTDRIGLDG